MTFVQNEGWVTSVNFKRDRRLGHGVSVCKKKLEIRRVELMEGELKTDSNNKCADCVYWLAEVTACKKTKTRVICFSLFYALDMDDILHQVVAVSLHMNPLKNEQQLSLF